MKNADMPAIPLPMGSETVVGQQGLTKREMFAMNIMSSLAGLNVHSSFHEMALDSVKAAELLLQVLDENK